VTTFNKEAGSVDLRHFQLSLTGDVWLSLRLMSRQTCETRGSWGEWFELHARQIQFQVSPSAWVSGIQDTLGVQFLMTDECQAVFGSVMFIYLSCAESSMLRPWTI